MAEDDCSFSIPVLTHLGDDGLCDGDWADDRGEDEGLQGLDEGRRGGGGQHRHQQDQEEAQALAGNYCELIVRISHSP